MATFTWNGSDSKVIWRNRSDSQQAIARTNSHHEEQRKHELQESRRRTAGLLIRPSEPPDPALLHGRRWEVRRPKWTGACWTSARWWHLTESAERAQRAGRRRGHISKVAAYNLTKRPQFDVAVGDANCRSATGCSGDLLLSLEHIEQPENSPRSGAVSRPTVTQW